MRMSDELRTILSDLLEVNRASIARLSDLKLADGSQGSELMTMLQAHREALAKRLAETDK
jgi:hypothetical protein